MKKSKVVLLTSMIPPYRIPVFNYLGRNGNFDFKVVALAESEGNRQWELAKEKIQFDYEVLPGLHAFIRCRDWPIHLNWGLLRRLIKNKGDIFILTGYESLSCWLTLIYTKLFRKKLIFWNGSTLESSRSNNFLINALRRLFIRSADSYLTYGTQAKEFLVHYGAKPEKVVVGCNTVGTDYFAKESSRLASKKEEIKKEKGYPSKIILFSGQLIPRKNLDVLLEAFKEIATRDIGLIVLGDGPLKSTYLGWCQKNELENVFFEGFRQIEELPKYYTVADVFVMPSLREVWGLVVNEAMACGLPVVVSSRAGAAYDLVKEGKNGYVFNPGDLQQLKEILERLLKNDSLRSEMGRKSFEIIKNYGVDFYADQCIKAIEEAQNK